MDRQAIINKLFQRFVVDFAPTCRTSDFVCEYARGSRRCAIGCLLPDKLAQNLTRASRHGSLRSDAHLERVLSHPHWGPPVCDALDLNPTNPDELVSDTKFLLDLQKWHDNFDNQTYYGYIEVKDRHERYDGLRDLANEYNLTVPELPDEVLPESTLTF